MRLYVNGCDNCGRRVYLDVVASSRSVLRRRFRSNYFYLTCNYCGYREEYSVYDVFAESETYATATGGIVGGLVGLIGGPAGVLIGGGLGAALGNQRDAEERSRVNFFNNSA